MQILKLSSMMVCLDSKPLLTFTSLFANSANNKLIIFFLFFPENRLLHFMQIVSLGDNLHGISKPTFFEK